MKSPKRDACRVSVVWGVMRGVDLRKMDFSDVCTMRALRDKTARAVKRCEMRLSQWGMGCEGADGRANDGRAAKGAEIHMHIFN